MVVMSSLQKHIDRTKKGGVIDIPYGGEYDEKITIDRPLTLRSVSSPIIIVGDGPTLSITNKNVLIENCIIEGRDEKSVCLSIKKKCKPTFKNVFVKGIVEGLDEKGIWEYPGVLELPLKPNKKCVVKIIIFCCAEAKLTSEISSITCNKNSLIEGLNEIEITIGSILKNSVITGDLVIETIAHKLKRRISLVGNTFNSVHDSKNSNGDYLWVCESSKCSINSDLIIELPEGFQNSPYQFVIDKKKLNCEDYDLAVTGLPKGITLEQSNLFSQITGTTDEFGEYDLSFIFKKNKHIFKFPSKIKIHEKVILPLEIQKIPDPIKVIENEAVSLYIKVINSNSPDIIYKKQGIFPEGIDFDDQSGMVFGAISEHGTYTSSIKIMDGTNELDQSINFVVEPEKPLNLNLKNEYRFYQNEPFDIHLAVDDSKHLNPIIDLKSTYSRQIKLSKEKNEYHLKGELIDNKNYDVTIKVKDKYKRELTAQCKIKCVQKPEYTLKWISKDQIYKKGQKATPFTEQLEVEILEDKELTIKFKKIGIWPTGFDLSEKGLVKGQIDGQRHNLQVRFFTDNWYCDQAIEIITMIDSSKVVTSSMDNLFSTAFASSSAKTNEGFDIIDEIKSQLSSGIVKENYQEYLLRKGNIITKHHQFIIKNLPKGLSFNPVTLRIEGKPEKSGVFFLEVYSAKNELLKKIQIKIKKSIFHSDKKTNESIVNKNGNKSSGGVSLGNAFLKKE